MTDEVLWRAKRKVLKVEMPAQSFVSFLQEKSTKIPKNILYINKIVADLQDFSRPLNPYAQEVDLNLIIDDVLKKNGLPENVELSTKVEPAARKL